MINIRDKSKILTISLILVLITSISFIALPLTAAQEGTMKTYAFINAVPNPVGMNQEVLLHVGITHALSLQPEGWEGLTVTVTKPDQTTETLGPFRTDSTGGTGTLFIPDQVGTYQLQTHFPEQEIPSTANPGGVTGLAVSTPAGTTMLESDSVVLNLVVQSEAVQYHPGFPLPTEYWTRPIDAQLREWYTIAGSWLEPQNWFTPRNLIAPYNDGPETAHVLWTRPHTIGGLGGGGLGDVIYQEMDVPHSFDIGDAYEGKWNNAFIVAGRGYYKKFSSAEPSLGAEYACVDLRTGEELWSKVFLDNRSIARSQLMYWDTYDFHGIFDYLIVTIGSTWHFFDSVKGEWHFTLTDVPGGNIIRGPKGEILRYEVDLENGWMALWNSTAVIQLYDSIEPGTMDWGRWRPQGKIVNATAVVPVTANTPLGRNGYEWNVTIQTGLPGSVQTIYKDRIIGSSLPAYTGTQGQRSLTNVTFWGISLEPESIGELMFSNTWDAPDEWAEGGVVTWVQGLTPYGEGGVAVVGARELFKFYGFSTDDGEFLWETDSQLSTDTPDAYLNWYGIPRERPIIIAYDKMFTAGIGGIVYAYNVKTGNLEWTYRAVDPYSEFLFNNNWWLYPLFVTDGKIYYGHLEHSPIDPRPRGAPFIALDVETGDEVFRVNGMFRQSLWGGRAIIGDSVILTQDTYDQRVYAIGKGPSATSIEAPLIAVPEGTSITLRGMVTDESPGTKDYKVMARFPNGVPAVADEHMSEWMLYVYKQFPHPTDVTGVTVTLDAVDQDGNFVNVGTATTDASGLYSFKWTPDAEGKYTIVATFMGSESYYSSYAQTAVSVDPVSPAGGIEPEGPTPLISTEVAILVAVVVIAGVALVAYWVLKKR